MGNKKIKYIFIDILIYLVISSIVLIFSKINITEKLTSIGLLLGFNIIALFIFMLGNYFWYKLFPKLYILINIFWLIAPIISLVIIIFTNLTTLSNEIEIMLFFSPLITIFLLSLYIKLNIIDKK